MPAEAGGTAAPIQVATASEPRAASLSPREVPVSMVLVPRRLLDSYQLASNLSMPAPLSLAAFSANDARFALVTQDRQLRVWDIATGNMVLTQDGFDAPATSSDNRAASDRAASEGTPSGGEGTPSGGEGTLSRDRPLGVFVTARFTSVSRGSAFSRPTTSTAAATAAPATPATALLAVSTFAAGALATTVLTFGMGITRAASYRRVDPVSNVVVAVGFAAGPTAGFQAISICLVGITAIAVYIAAPPFAAPAFAAVTLVAVALAFRASLIVATL